MNWPWVSRARLDAANERIVDLKKELEDLRSVYRRVEDRIVFKSSGFHLYPEFEEVAEPDAPISAAPKKDIPEVDLNSTEKAIQQYGPRMRSVVTAIEQENLAAFSEHEGKFQSARQRDAAEKALKIMEDTLSKSRTA